MSRSTKMLCLLSLLLLALSPVACKREVAPAAAPGPAQKAAESTGKIEAPTLDDVVERDPRYIVGISYPAVARQHPGLGRLLKAYADAAHGELMQAVSGLGDDKPTAPYDLSLGFTQTADTPDIVAIAADGSTYTGGAHGMPLVARFVWLPRQASQLTADALVADAAGWQVIADYVREQLHTALAERVDSDQPTPAERAERLANGVRMIDEGTAPAPSNFDQFEPVLDPEGKILALRFVFPPYQVGPYSEGVQSVVVPTNVLLPLVAAQYRPLFAGG